MLVTVAPAGAHVALTDVGEVTTTVTFLARSHLSAPFAVSTSPPPRLSASPDPLEMCSARATGSSTTICATVLSSATIWSAQGSAPLFSQFALSFHSKRGRVPVHVAAQKREKGPEEMCVRGVRCERERERVCVCVMTHRRAERAPGLARPPSSHLFLAPPPRALFSPQPVNTSVPPATCLARAMRRRRVAPRVCASMRGEKQHAHAPKKRHGNKQQTPWSKKMLTRAQQQVFTEETHAKHSTSHQETHSAQCAAQHVYLPALCINLIARTSATLHISLRNDTKVTSCDFRFARCR
jgi:hypothetical protein